VVKRRPSSVPQSREEVEVAGRQVGTVGGVVQALPTEGGNMVDRCCCRVGSRIIPTHSYAPSRNCWHHRRSCIYMTSGPYTSTRQQLMLAGHALFRCPSLTQHCAGTACAMKVVRPSTKEEDCLWTQNTVTPQQFYAVPGNKMEKLIIRLSYVYTGMFVTTCDISWRFI
jgi:hypothetical protein